jgi:hypothetical protein
MSCVFLMSEHACLKNTASYNGLDCNMVLIYMLYGRVSLLQEWQSSEIEIRYAVADYFRGHDFR